MSLATATIALATALTGANASAEVTIRFASDTVGPPHPAGIAMEIFKEKVEAAIPGAKVRNFVSSSLYKNAEAIEAMTEGNLEMAWGQFGKTAVLDPWTNVLLGPMRLTTAGAINELDNFESFKVVQKRFKDVHDVTIFGTAHLSFYMGAGAGFRLLSPDDFKGKKVRSMGPAENAMLRAFGANPTTMAFGDVPPALQTKVIDGLLTSLGGWNKVKENAPFYSIAGINGIVGDYYYIAYSNKWWAKLKPAHQKVIAKIMTEEVLPWAKRANFCNDKRLIDKYETKDPSKPGIFIMNSGQSKALADKLGNATSDWIKENTPDAANQWVDKFAQEASAAVASNPHGSNWLEKTDCASMEPIFMKYTKK
ncbi:MAG: TRAP transporter substrate-binding protein DctP [Rhodospirillaceae bacterium]|nr:TRAP transporter substrate-binding protein DctP [Rhodospirillaceae bacterium]